MPKQVCECDMRYINEGEGEETIKAFFSSHPFMTGFLVGYASKESSHKVIDLLKEVVDENYNNPNGWGRR